MKSRISHSGYAGYKNVPHLRSCESSGSRRRGLAAGVAGDQRLMQWNAVHMSFEQKHTCKRR